MAATRPSERTTSAKAAGILLGTLEDLVATTLLVVVLVVVKLLGLLCSRVVQPPFHDRLLTSLVLRHVGHCARFLTVLALTIVWLTFYAADLLLVCTLNIRLTTTVYDRAPSPTQNQSRRDVFFSPEIIVGVGGVSLLLAGFFTWVMDILHGVPVASSSLEGRATNQESLERTRVSSGVSNVTPTYLETSFVVFRTSSNDSGWEVSSLHDSDEDDGSVMERHITIISAANEVDEYPLPVDARPRSHSQPVLSKRPRSLTRRHRTIARGIVALTGFLLFASGTFAIAKVASPVVAAIALNATLNELCRGFIGTEFLPKTVTR